MWSAFYFFAFLWLWDFPSALVFPFPKGQSARTVQGKAEPQLGNFRCAKGAFTNDVRHEKGEVAPKPDLLGEFA